MTLFRVYNNIFDYIILFRVYIYVFNQEQRESLDTVVHVSDLQIISPVDKLISQSADFSGPVADLATADTEKRNAANITADKIRSSYKREKVSN